MEKLGLKSNDNKTYSELQFLCKRMEIRIVTLENENKNLKEMVKNHHNDKIFDKNKLLSKISKLSSKMLDLEFPKMKIILKVTEEYYKYLPESSKAKILEILKWFGASTTIEILSRMEKIFKKSLKRNTISEFCTQMVRNKELDHTTVITGQGRPKSLYFLRIKKEGMG